MTFTLSTNKNDKMKLFSSPDHSYSCNLNVIFELFFKTMQLERSFISTKWFELKLRNKFENVLFGACLKPNEHTSRMIK